MTSSTDPKAQNAAPEEEQRQEFEAEKQFEGRAFEMKVGNSVYNLGRRLYLSFPPSWRHGLYDEMYLSAIKRYPKLMYLRPATDEWKIGKKDGLVSIERKGSSAGELLLDHIDAVVTMNEWPIWEKYYLPDFSLKGKTVLTVGAACGDTAYFYFMHGAKRVVGVETDRERCRIFRGNSERLRWDAEIINAPFDASHLDIPHDFLEVDCEGGEAVLLKVDAIKPAIMELHPWVIGEENVRAIIEKFHLRNLYSSIWATPLAREQKPLTD